MLIGYEVWGVQGARHVWCASFTLPTGGNQRCSPYFNAMTLFSPLPPLRHPADARSSRRMLLVQASRWTLGGALVNALGAALNPAQAAPGYTVTEARLQQAVAKRFPRRYPVGGFLDIDAKAPRLSLLPAKNRLAAQLQVAAAGPALPRAYQGVFDLDFALRYQASDRTVRADQLRVNALQFENLPAQTSALLTLYGPQLAEQSLQGAVLHQLKAEDLALPDGMGLQPDTITVTAQGLVIAFVAKPL